MSQWNIEELWSIVMLMAIALGGYIPVLMNGLNAADSRFQYDANAFSSPISRVVIAGILIGTVVPAARIYRVIRKGALSLAPLLPYIAFASMSWLWSQDADLSLRRLLSFLATCLFGLYFALRFDARSQVRMVLTATLLLALGSILLIGVAPQYGIDHTQHAGAWQGVFAGKNACGMVMLIGMLSAMVVRPKSVASRIGRSMTIVLFATIIVLAQSSGSIVLMGMLWILIPLLRHINSYERQAKVFVCTLIGLGFSSTVFLLVQYLSSLLKLLNRDSTLTGRTLIWADVMHSIAKRPLLGYGYGAFWTGIAGESSNIVLSFRWAVPNAHNGYLDIWLSLGAIGLVLFLWALLQSLRRILQVALAEDMLTNLWFVGSILLVILYNIDESVLISAPSLMWTLFVSGICGLELYAARPAAVRMKPFQYTRVSLYTDQGLTSTH